MNKIDEWFSFCKKNLRMFLRRIYVMKKTIRERELNRPFNESEVKSERRYRPTHIINIVVVSITFFGYLFLLPTPPKLSTFSEKTIEEIVKFNPKLLKKNLMLLEARRTLEKKRISRMERRTNTSITLTTEKNVETDLKQMKVLEESFKARTNVIFKDKNTTLSNTTKAPTTFNLISCIIRVNLSDTNVTLKWPSLRVSLDTVYPEVREGGYYKPDHCLALHKVAIIVPYRDRSLNLKTFLYNLHPFLMAQNLEYRIFVIEQFGSKKFNRGLLFNVGFKEVKKYGDWRCIILHDVDLLPLDRRILYTCPQYPRHMSSHVIDPGTRRNTSSPMAFGGVAAISVEDYQKANGHSNLYWGWGGEDFDMFWRIRATMTPIVRYNKTIAKYRALPHSYALENPLRYSLLRKAVTRWETDGLQNLEYKVVSVTQHHLFTHILVNIHPWEDDGSKTTDSFGKYNKLRKMMLKYLNK